MIIRPMCIMLLSSNPGQTVGSTLPWLHARFTVPMQAMACIPQLCFPVPVLLNVLCDSASAYVIACNTQSCATG